MSRMFTVEQHVITINSVGQSRQRVRKFMTNLDLFDDNLKVSIIRHSRDWTQSNEISYDSDHCVKNHLTMSS